MKILVILAFYFFPATQCSFKNIIEKGKSIVQGKDINYDSSGIFSTHWSCDGSDKMDSLKGFKAPKFLYTEKQKSAIEFIQSIPELKKQGKLSVGGLAILEVKDPESLEGRRALLRSFLEDLNSLNRNTQYLQSLLSDSDHIQLPYLKDTLNEVDKLILLHVNHRISVLTSDEHRIDESQEFPDLINLDEQNIVKYLASLKNMGISPHKSFGIKISHCQLLDKIKSPELFLGSKIHKDDCTCEMRKATNMLIEKMISLPDQIKKIENTNPSLGNKCTKVLFQALNVMFKHQCIGCKDVQRFFDRINVEYAASYMNSLDKSNYIPSSESQTEFIYPKFITDMYSHWYMSDFMNLFSVLDQYQTQGHILYFWLTLQFKEYWLKIYSTTEKWSYYDKVIVEFSKSLTSIRNEYKNVAGKVEALTAIYPSIEEAFIIFNDPRFQLSAQLGGSGMILLSHFFEFLREHDQGMFFQLGPDHQNFITTLRLLHSSKCLLSQIDKLHFYIHHKFSYRLPHHPQEHPDIIVENHPIRGLEQLDKISTYIEMITQEHSKIICSLLNTKYIDGYFFHPHVQSNIESIQQQINFVKMQYRSNLYLHGSG